MIQGTRFSLGSESHASGGGGGDIPTRNLPYSTRRLDDFEFD